MRLFNLIEISFIKPYHIHKGKGVRETPILIINMKSRRVNYQMVSNQRLIDNNCEARSRLLLSNVEN